MTTTRKRQDKVHKDKRITRSSTSRSTRQDWRSQDKARQHNTTLVMTRQGITIQHNTNSIQHNTRKDKTRQETTEE
jgi:hypothetical protein